MGQATGSPLLDLKNTEIKPCQVATYGQYNYYTKSFIITLFKMQSNIKENGNNKQCQMYIRNKAALSYYTEN